jgi:hypothetical protein
MSRTSYFSLSQVRQGCGNNVTWLVKVLGVMEEVPIRGTRDHRIAQIAGAQRGRVASRQLLAAGISTSTTGRLVARACLFPIHRAVFAVGHTAPVELGDETAALLAVGGTAALSHLSAAILWGLLPPDAGDGLIHATAAEDHRLCLNGVVLHRSFGLTAADLRIRSGLPVLSPARALLDTAELVTERRLELAFDRALVDRLVRPHEITELVARTSGRRGGPLLKAQLARLTDGPTLTRSAAEERFRRAFEHNRRKDAVLQAAGIATLRFTWRQLQDEPLAAIARLAALLARA